MHFLFTAALSLALPHSYIYRLRQPIAITNATRKNVTRNLRGKSYDGCCGGGGGGFEMSISMFARDFRPRPLLRPEHTTLAHHRNTRRAGYLPV